MECRKCISSGLFFAGVPKDSSGGGIHRPGDALVRDRRSGMRLFYDRAISADDSGGAHLRDPDEFGDGVSACKGVVDASGSVPEGK